MRGTPAGNWLKPGLGMVIMSLLVQRIGQRRRATPALLQWLHSGKGPHRLRAFLLPAGSPQSGKRKPGTSAGLGLTHSEQRGASFLCALGASAARIAVIAVIQKPQFTVSQL